MPGVLRKQSTVIVSTHSEEPIGLDVETIENTITVEMCWSL